MIVPAAGAGMVSPDFFRTDGDNLIFVVRRRRSVWRPKNTNGRWPGKRLEDERKEQIELSPLCACERMRELLSQEVEGRLQTVGKAPGAKVDKALLALSFSWRRYVAFSNELATITGKNVYQIRANLGSEIRSYDLRRRLPSGPNGIYHTTPIQIV
jgi:hypothetical protein